MNHDFSGRPLVAGSLIGLRAFVIRDEALVGPVYAIPFGAGENLAHCAGEEPDWFKDKIPAPVFSIISTSLAFTRGHRIIMHDLATSLASMTRSEPPPPPVEHALACDWCSCGFYAYTDGGNDYGDDGPLSTRTRWTLSVEAVIEGYGVCTVGSRGFRASKARLVALVDPPAEIAERYGVPTYETRALALAAHPLTPPAPIEAAS